MENETTVNDLVIQHATQNKQSQETIITDTTGDDKSKVTTEVDTPPPSALDELLKEHNLTSIEELKAKLKGDKQEGQQKSPEEIEKEKELYEAELISYAVKNGDMKLDDFSRLQELKKVTDRDLVFENYKKDFKEENPEIEEEDFEEAAKSAFEEEYKLSSANEKAKLRGEARIAKEAKEVRTPLESSYENVKGKYSKENEIRRAYPDFEKKINATASEVTPGSFDLFKDKDGDEEINVSLPLSEDDKKAVSAEVVEAMRTEEVFELFKKGEFDKINEIASKLSKSIIWDKYRDAGMKEIATTFLTRGKAKAAIGATNSFALNGQGQQQADPSKQSKEQQVLDSLNNKKT